MQAPAENACHPQVGCQQHPGFAKDVIRSGRGFHGCFGVWAVGAYMYRLEIECIITGDRAQWVTNYRFVSVCVFVYARRLVLEQWTGSRLQIPLAEVRGDRLWCNHSEGQFLKQRLKYSVSVVIGIRSEFLELVQPNPQFFSFTCFREGRRKSIIFYSCVFFHLSIQPFPVL